MSVTETHRDGPQSNRNRLDSVISLQATESRDDINVLQVLVKCFAEIATRQSAYLNAERDSTELAAHYCQRR